MTTAQLEEQSGSVDEATSWIAAVYDATENWVAAVQWNQEAEVDPQFLNEKSSLNTFTA